MENKQLEATLKKLTQKMQEDVAIKEFNLAKKRLDKVDGLSELIEKLKTSNQNIVKFDHVNLTRHKEKALEDSEKYTRTFKAMPAVNAYRQALSEADDLLQFVTNRIESAINQTIEREEEI